MDWKAIELWFKGTILGIVLLGAAGSIVAVWIGKLLWPAALAVLRLPMAFHHRKKGFQAFLLGFSSAHIDHDKTDRRLIAFMGFHLMKFILLAILAATAWLTFLLLVLAAGRPVLTASSYGSIVVLFLALYGAYFEAEYIYRMFLSLWKAALKLAKEGYDKGDAESSAPSAPKDTPYS